MKWRVLLLTGGILVAYSALVFNLYGLQLERGDYYFAKAGSQYQSSGLLQPQRGNIYFIDKNQNAISAVINKNYPIIFAVPQEIIDAPATSQILSEILSLDKEKLTDKLSQADSLYWLLSAKATAEQVEKVRAANLAGVYVDRQEFRFYPFDELASQVLGFIAPSDQDETISGRYGLELYFNDLLKGRPGQLDFSGQRGKTTNPVDGADINLTIDANIQTRAEEILDGLIKDYDAVGGTVIVQEPTTGRILAMGNYPNFNPNNYADYSIRDFLNPAVQAVYEPGSVVKVLTMAAGIDSGRLTPTEKYTDTGSVTFNGRTIKNFEPKPYGEVDMITVLAKSINTGAVYAQRKVGNDAFYDYLVKFGLKDPTGVDLPGEVGGSLINLERNARDINFATAAFGQGIAMTPLQLIAAISALANDGVLMKPILMSGESPTAVRRVIMPETASQVAEMMAEGVRRAQASRIPNYRIAGKTGTAQVPDFHKGGYTEEIIHTYVGFAPASNPRFTILIKIDKPRGAPLASMTVMPAFRELAEFIINYYNIEPDDISS